MENKTITHLNSKVWYRALKVAYILLFLIIFYAYNVSLSWYGIGGFIRKTITFSNGQKVTFDGVPTEQDIEEVAVKLGLHPVTVTPEISPVSKTVSYQEFCGSEGCSVVKSEVKPQKISTSFNYGNFVKDFVSVNLLFVFTFELFRRCFYYIVLGKLRPTT